MKMSREFLKEANRIVIKVGTSTLTYGNGKMNLKRMDEIALVLSDLLNKDKKIVLVTSGAISVGAAKLKLEKRPSTIPEKQAVAAVGQCELMNMYSTLFSKYGQTVGQILLTKKVIEDKISKNNVINTFEALFNKGILPIVNENDSVSIEEIKHIRNFGDNDTLSAIVAKLCKADLLIILTDTDGLHDDDPGRNPKAKLISTVEKIDENIEKVAGEAVSKMGTGGFITKIHAAKLVTESGINMVIANGEKPAIINDILNGKKVGTLFNAIL